MPHEKSSESLNRFAERIFEQDAGFDSHCTKDTILPALPPTLPIALLTLCAAPLTAGPADEVSLERPCEVLEAAFEAVSLELTAVSFIASAVEACRLAVRRAINRVCRSIMRDGATIGMNERWLDIGSGTDEQTDKSTAGMDLLMI